MEATAWIVVLFLQGTTYIGTDEFYDYEACKAAANLATYNTLMTSNCIPTKRTPQPPPRTQ